MNVRVYKKLYRALLEREHIGRLPETIFVDVRDYISVYAEKNGRVATAGRLRNAKQTFHSWLVRYHKDRVRKPSEETLGYMQLLGILFLYVWHIEAREGIEDDFLVEESVKEFNRNREYRRTFVLPRPPRRRGRPPAQLASLQRTVRKKAASKKSTRKVATRKTTARKTAARKTVAPKAATRKTATRKTATRKAATRKTATRKAATRKVTARKSAAKTAAKKAAIGGARKSAAKKATGRKASRKR